MNLFKDHYLKSVDKKIYNPGSKMIKICKRDISVRAWYKFLKRIMNVKTGWYNAELQRRFFEDFG